MAPGFFHKLFDIGKKIWTKGKEVVKQIVPGVKKAIEFADPLLKTVAPAFEKSDNASARQFGSALSKARRGLERVNPIIQRLM